MKLVKLTVAAAALVVVMAGVAYADAVDVATEAGIAQRIRSFSVNSEIYNGTQLDYNGDTLDDFFLVRHAPEDLGANIPPSSLYAGNGNGFTEQSISFQRAGSNTDKHGCTWGDVNRDNRPDMFCAIGLTQNSKNELWIQTSTGGFNEVARARGFYDYFKGRYRYATFIHANNDALLDVYVARYTGSCFCDLNGDGVVDYDGDEFPNELWLQNPDGTFTFDAPTAEAPSGQYGLTQNIGAKKDNATCAQAVDYDGDADEDLLVCGMKKLKLYENNAGTGFTDVTSAKGITGDAQDARLIDLNGDTKEDLVKLTNTALTVRYGNGTGGFSSVTTLTTTTAGEALAFGRFDPGPTLDIYQLSGKASGEQPDQILVNNGVGFDIITLPGVPKADGDDVGRADYNNNGQDDFIVTNGDKKIYGPVQLFTWRAPLT